MAINSTSLTSPFFVLLLVCVLSLLQEGSPSRSQHFHKLRLDSLLPDSTCAPFDDSKNEKGNSSVLRLVSRFGPCSPFANSDGSHPSATQLLLQDEVRIKWLLSRASGELQQEQTSLPAYWGNQLSTYNFVVQIGLGRPRQDFVVIFDTGSDLTWVQCDPCLTFCHPQAGPRFSPSNSSTFRYSSCTSPECIELRSEKYLGSCSSARCIYHVPYADGSSTTGYFGQDNLALLPNDVFSNFKFGCGERNTGLFGKEAGLLGLGRRKLSVVSQTVRRYGGVFSYCLPTGSSTGFLTFGPGSGSNSATYTRLLTMPQHPSFYYVSLMGLSVGGQLLPVPSSSFRISGTILDSGTIITRLQSAAYVALRGAFRKRMTNYTLIQAVSILDTCYDFSGYNSVVVPQITFHFEKGAKLVPPAYGVLFPVGGNRFCLGFAPTTGSTVIGNWQQRTTQIVHDVAHSTIGFRPGACL